MLNEFVHVIDDDEAARESLAFLLESADMPNRTYASAELFLAALPDVKSGCVVTDVRMPGMSGLDLLGRLIQAKSTLPVIVITGHSDVHLAVSAMKAGAVDFIEKPFDDDTLLSAIRAALARHADDSQRQRRIDEVRGRLDSLSEREREVLDRLVAGKPNKIIAHELGISARTVEVYRANVMTKMRADSLPDLVRMVLLEGVRR